MLSKKQIFRMLVLLSIMVSFIIATKPVHGAPCDVAGAIISNTTWSSDSCDFYNVVGNVIVSEDVTLTIKPGTELYFSSDTGITVRGTLNAIGTEGNPILFTSAQGSPAIGDWTGLFFEVESQSAILDAQNNYVSGSIVQFSTIEYAVEGIRMKLAAPYIEHNTLAFNEIGVFGESYTTIDPPVTIIKNNTITNNSSPLRGAGIRMGYGRYAYILDNIVSHNTAEQSGGGMYLWAGILGNSSTYVVSGNTIIHNTASTDTNYGHGGGVLIEGHGSFTNNIVAHNRVVGGASVGGGVAFLDSPLDYQVRGNIVINNESAFGGGLYFGISGMQGIISDNLISNNKASDEGGGVMFEFINDAEDFLLEHNSIYDNVADGMPNDAAIETNSDGRDDVRAMNNWWGSTNLATVESRVLHAVDDAERGLILLQPLLTEAPSNNAFIPTSGGSFTSEDGIVTVTVPSNAASEPITIYYNRLSSPTLPLPENSLFVQGFNLNALTDDGINITQFNNSLTVTVKYPSDSELAAAGVSEDRLVFAYWNGSEWVEILPCSGCSQNLATNTLTVRIDHLTEFALFGQSEEQAIFLPFVVK